MHERGKSRRYRDTDRKVEIEISGMFKSSATGNDPILNAFFAEIRLHILIAEKAYTILYHQHLYASGDKKKEYTCSPLELMTSFANFLNSAAMLTKILGLSSSFKGNKNRAKHLRENLALSKNEFKELTKVNLRNSMEHMDERLDCIAKNPPKRLVAWDLTKYEAEDHTLRKFDPLKFTMSCLDQNLKIQTFDVRDCYNDIQYIKNRIEKAERH